VSREVGSSVFKMKMNGGNAGKYEENNQDGSACGNGRLSDFPALINVDRAAPGRMDLLRGVFRMAGRFPVVGQSIRGRNPTKPRMLD
jgi:hypothetical protein